MLCLSIGDVLATPLVVENQNGVNVLVSWNIINVFSYETHKHLFVFTVFAAGTKFIRELLLK